MPTEERVRPRGLVTEIARAIGWIAIGKSVSKLPRLEKDEEDVTAVEMPRQRSLPLSKIEIVLASIAGVILAMFPHHSASRNAMS